jgi:YbgC/YbaW family acyl-CoA thioester hydrolase
MKKLNEAQIKELISTYKHRLDSKVRFEDVDSFGVVHNIKYLYWVEWARTEYMRDMMFPEHKGNFLLEMPVLVVRNEIDYYNSASFNQEYSILSKTDSIGSSSMKFDNLILLRDDDEILKPLVRCYSILTHIDLKTKTKKEINPDTIARMEAYEGRKLKK